jgi:hypothetical protein
MKPPVHPGRLPSSGGSETSGSDSGEPRRPPEGAGSKTAFREGAQEGGCVVTKQSEEQPAAVPREGGAKQAGEVRARWPWTEPTVWTQRMLTTLEKGVKGGKWFKMAPRLLCRSGAVLHGRSPRNGLSIRSAVNHQPESRVRENRTHGSEGGGTGVKTGSSYPYHLSIFNS